MGAIVYRKESFCIQEVFSCDKKGYILFNEKKSFADGHTHLNNYKSAKYILNLAVKRKLPLDLDLYRMESLYRILEDSIFRENVEELLKKKKIKQKQKYINVSKGPKS